MTKFSGLSRPRTAYFGFLLACLITGLIIVTGGRPTGQSASINRQPIRPQTIAQSTAKVTASPSNLSPATSPTPPTSVQKPTTATTPPVTSSAATTTPTTATTSTVAPASPTTNSATSPAPAADVKVTLEVNGSLMGTVQLAASSNQCDVLSQALADGLIQSLNMQYNATYQTQAVYQINGQGSASSVWWVFSVNGTEPPYGCGQVLVHEGDTVNWKYI